jgi:hypothetical protein
MARSNRDLASGPVSSSSARNQRCVHAAAPSRSGSSSACPLLDGCEGAFNGGYDARRLIEEDNAIIEFGGQDALDQTCAEALAVGGIHARPILFLPDSVRGAGAWIGAFTASCCTG